MPFLRQGKLGLRKSEGQAAVEVEIFESATRFCWPTLVRRR